MKTDKGIKVTYIGADTVKQINCSLGSFRVKTSETGERFVRVPTKEIADKLATMYPKEFRGHTGTAVLKRKGSAVSGRRTEGLDRGEVEDDGSGMDEEEKLLAQEMSDPNANFRASLQ